MCGFLFVSQNQNEISEDEFERTVDLQVWRGPDAKSVLVSAGGSVMFGHNRLSIIDPYSRSNQPMKSECGRYTIVYNGEIYNHLSVRDELGLSCITASDTETLLAGFQKLGLKILDYIDGMFAFVVYDHSESCWYAARDRFGIKPLFIFRDKNKVVIGSEAGAIAKMLNLTTDSESIKEWKLLRRPVPGYSFFENLQEFPPASYCSSEMNHFETYWELLPAEEPYSQGVFNSLLEESVKEHQLSDVENVSLLSGGIDSALITLLSDVGRAYSVGSKSNNEFEGANESASVSNVELKEVVVDEVLLDSTWRKLIQLRGEPLSVPNEGLIYLVCMQMDSTEKVVLTGEGADELLFGYDGIFRWALKDEWEGEVAFLRRYGYALDVQPSRRSIEYVRKLKKSKSVIEFVEDFFWFFHLPGLLRRMDFASMAASKEARVPFVSRKLAEYMYRRPHQVKINQVESKIPARSFALSVGLSGAVARKKIGFSATTI